MLTRIRSVLGLGKPAHLKEDSQAVPEESRASLEQSGPPLMVLISTGGVLSFQLHSFADAESAAEFIQSGFPPGMKQGIFAFWALQGEPEPAPEVELRGTTDVVLLIRDPARPGVVDLISCVDMKSAQSLARGEAKQGLDPSLFLVYWALPVTIETDEKKNVLLTPAVPPPVVRRTPPAQPAVEAEPAAPRAEEVEIETTVGAPVVEEAPAAEPAVEAEPAAPRAEEAEVKARPKVIIVDPDQEGRTEIQKMLALSSFAVLGQTGYGREAIVLAKQSKPDVLMVAIEEPIVRATKMVEALADLLPQSPIVVYSSSKDTDSIRRAMLAGAKDYLVTPVKEEELVRSVHTVLAQEERCRQRLRGEVEGPATVGKVITVFGAKGGIGKTTIATNLAAAIAQETRESVVLVDLDPRFGDVGILLDIPAERSIADLALPAEEITKELIQDSLYTHNTGVTILAAPVRPTEWRNVQVGHIERVVTLLAQTYDYVFLDTPGTFNDVVTRALELATTVLLVTTPHITSLKDTLLAINMLRSWNLDQDKIKLVVNATNDATSALPKDMERMLGQEVFWSIPYDPNIPVTAQLGTPAVIAQTKAADSLTEMAMALSGARAYRKQEG